ncbi:conserved hypothetical protein [Leishmania braziliensis MHOM/BR/75/M2904]|uniref:Uncharacterized protein n=2 Tax=Leishmania braziliensis TaxID=5660 RepID=A4H8A7_LEIBR|nr:conserved hypothetical protein [Leishmania braziliensis MHOM/BR/75/M2904]CAJ2469459.1 unnamed protein product [Leishmania braziliensis]CAM42156.1 conserved hypothetical protein [Leishmania braziliensis MHOM/BR/75/M2904]
MSLPAVTPLLFSISVMEAEAIAWYDYIVPDVIADVLKATGDRTGMRWGVMPAHQYWFQSPKLHVVLYVVAVVFCAVLHRQSRGFRSAAIRRLSMAGLGRSLKCPINKLIAYMLMVCLAVQGFTKASRAKPFVQLGWLLMPCHLFTGMWIYVLMRDRPHHYGSGCYLASLLVDWVWSPLGALAHPDWGDHQYLWEGYVFLLHHGVLLLLPLYFVARYDTLGLDWAHLCHLTWVSTLFNFAFLAPCGLLLGLNVNYQLAPPRLSSRAPTVVKTALYRPALIPVFVALSIIANIVVRLLGRIIRKLFTSFQKLTKSD